MKLSPQTIQPSLRTCSAVRHAPGLLLTLLLALLPVACSNDSQPVAGDASTPQSVLNDPFVVATPQVGEIFDAASVLPAEISALSFNMYDWMFDRAPDGSPRPGYASSWEMSADRKLLTVNLREDVLFHTGTPMTADDIVFTWERIQEGGFSSRITRSLEQIEILGPHQVRFHFNRPELAFVAVGGLPVLSRAYYDAVGPEQFRQQPVGTGPYRFKQLQRGQYVDLERFEQYWRDKPEIPRVRFEFVTEDTTRVSKLRTGEADMAMMLPFPLVPLVEAEPALKTVTLLPGGMTIFLALKADNPDTPWADPRVREAIAIAIDKNAIVEHILLGYPEHYPFLAPGDLGYDPTLQAHPYDPERARTLLEEAGVTGLKMQIRYISGGATGVKETAEAVALYLNEIGIAATTVALEGPQFIPWVLKASRNPDMDYAAVFIGGIAGRSESSNPLVAQLGGDTPFAWYSDPAMYERIRQMAVMTDDEERARAIIAIGQAVHADMRYIPLWTSAHIYGMKNCIDFTPTLGEYDLLLLRDVRIDRCQAAAAAP